MKPRNPFIVGIVSSRVREQNNDMLDVDQSRSLDERKRNHKINYIAGLAKEDAIGYAQAERINIKVKTNTK